MAARSIACNGPIAARMTGSGPFGLTPAKSLTLGPLSLPLRPRLYGSRARRQAPVLRVRATVRLDRVGQPGVRRVAADVSLASHRHHWVDRSKAPARPQPDLEIALCEGGIDRSATLDVPRTRLPCLGRKRAAAEKFLVPLGSAAARSTGRPRAGWRYGAGEFPSQRDPRIL